MMDRFKPGDVISYRDGHSDAIVDHVLNGQVYVSFWRHSDYDGEWIRSDQPHGDLIMSGPIIHHPEVDRVLVSFTAWRLTQ